MKKETKDITERVKSFEDACAVLGIHDLMVMGACETKDEWAYKKLKVIVKALNEGWEPDWGKGDRKFWPWFYYNAGSGFAFDVYGCVRTDTDVGSRLCFKTRELAEYAGRQFADIYNDFLS